MGVRDHVIWTVLDSTWGYRACVLCDIGRFVDVTAAGDEDVYREYRMEIYGSAW